MSNETEFNSTDAPLEFPCDPNSLPTSSELPIGDMILEIKSMREDKSKENLDGTLNPRTGLPKVGGKKMVVIQYTLDQPEEMAGIPHTERILLGTDTDPLARKDVTWRLPNAGKLMGLFKFAHVGGNSVAERFAAAVGQKVGATVKRGKDDPIYGARNEIRSYWEPGTKQVSVISPNADLDSAFAAPLPPRFEEKD